MNLVMPLDASPSESTKRALREVADRATGERLHSRVYLRGKFFFVGDEKFFIKGVTYGPFEPREDGSEYGVRETVDRDFAAMAAHGINAVRTYTVPPRWLLDVAQRHQLKVMVGVPWEQHIAFLDQPRTIRQIEGRVREAVRSCSGHPAILCFSIGNEIPAPIVRWHGPRRVERFLARLYRIAKHEDPDALVTYVNYPSTEYLNLPFLDFLAFNVYLEAPETLSKYLGRLQNIAGDRPLMMAEVGLDSLRNGEAKQAFVLDWQIRTAFAEGGAGLFVFSWTDEWYRGGQNIHDWKFGLTGVDRHPKPALHLVQAAYRDVPVTPAADWPLVSVVICTYNGARTLRQTLEGVCNLSYPRYEVIVVNDGSNDASGEIASGFNVELVSIPNGGLSNARNVGWQRARGKIIAYIDDDATPDVHWLTYLVSGLLRSNFAGVAGPNLAPPKDGFIATCVDHSPGNPTHVLIDDREAEHLPGCNMAYWRECIESVGGFDSSFRIAGDDVDFCWRLQQHGWVLGFSPAAVVWHHRRGTIRTYWKQQMNYGRAEAMLERKWPEKYNAAGHLSWAGRVYAKAIPRIMFWRSPRIYHGTWGSALFQSVYDIAPYSWSSIFAMPEWYMIVASLGVAALAGLFYAPLQWMIYVFAVAAFASILRVVAVVSHIQLQIEPRSVGRKMVYWSVVSGLHFLQPIARLWGRISFGLTPWRRRVTWPFALPWKRSATLWDEKWRSVEERLAGLESRLQEAGAVVARGGDFDRWDLEVRGGILVDVRLLMTVEEHGQGKQFVRIRLWPSGTHWALVMAPMLASVAISGALQLDWRQLFLINIPFVLLTGRMIFEIGTAVGAIFRCFERTPQATRPAGRVAVARVATRVSVCTSGSRRSPSHVLHTRGE